MRGDKTDKTFVKIVVGAAFLAMLASCTEFFFPPLAVTGVSIQRDSSDTSRIELLRVHFSAQPERTSLEKALSVSENGSKLLGTIRVEGKDAVFTPLDAFKENKDYTLSVTTDAEDTNGNSLLKMFRHNFTTKPEQNVPTILAITPAKDSELELGTFDAIEIFFSKPVDIPAFVKAFSVSPSFGFLSVFSADDTCVRIIPDEPLTNGTRYTVTLNTALTDRHGNELRQAFVSTFLYGIDRTPPSYALSIVAGGSFLELSDTAENRNIPVTAELLLQFDEKVAIDSVNSFISIQPAAQMKIVADNESANSARIQFSGKLAWNQTYTLTIREGIADVSGNKTTTRRNYKIVSDSELCRPLTIMQAYIDSGSLSSPNRFQAISPENSFSDMLFPVSRYPTESPVASALYFVVNMSAEAQTVSLVSAMQAIRIEAENSCIDIKIRKIEVDTLDKALFSEISPQFVAEQVHSAETSGQAYGIKVHLEITNKDNHGFLKFSVSDKLSDDIGNTLSAAWNAIFNKV